MAEQRYQTNAAALAFIDLSERFEFADLLTVEAVQTLYPYMQRARDEDLAGGNDLSNLCAMMRAYLQSFGIAVEL